MQEKDGPSCGGVNGTDYVGTSQSLRSHLEIIFKRLLDVTV